MKLRTRTLIVCIAPLLGVARGPTASPAVASTQSSTLYVSPHGRDTWSGLSREPRADQTDGPLATLHAAVEAARKLAPAGPRSILLREGEYFLDRPVVLNAQDAGLTIEAAPGTKPILYGGRPITGWHPDGERFQAADLPEVVAKRWDLGMLVVNGRLCTLARLPKEGCFTHLSHFDVPWMSTTGGGWKRKPTLEELTTLKYRKEDLGAWLDLRNAELTVYHMWDESVVGLAKMDESHQTLTFSNPAGHPPGAFGVPRYVVHNVREGMTEPGQWYLDRTAGKVVYWPSPGEDMARAKSAAPTMKSLFRIEGSPTAPARDITLRGLTLSVTNTSLVAGGFGAGDFEGAVSIAHAQDCRLEGLTIANVAGQGIKASAVKRLRVTDCDIGHTGACGAIVGGSGCVVNNNHVHHVGCLHPSGIAVWGSGREGSGIEISHNEIHDTPYSAIVCNGDNHRIEHNLVYRAMQEMHDGAGIYITFCKHVVVRGNFIRDIVDTGGYGASAYYLDEQAENCVVEDNLSLRVSRPSHNHMARSNVIRNNVFVCDGDAILTFPKSSEYQVENNVVWAKGKVTITNPSAISAARHNVVFSNEGTVEGVTLDGYRPMGEAPIKGDADWLLADPLLVEFETGRVRFSAKSPALRLGIRPIDVSTAGRLKPGDVAR